MSPTFSRALVRPALPLLLSLALAACASSKGAQAPAAPVPQAQPAATSSPLQPPEAAVRASQHLRPTGLELGTMWTFENPPLDYWARTYNFRPTKEWLDNVRLSSVRFADYCSASFVSSDGLVMTNHHCGRECVEAQSTPQRDYVTTGFYAATRAEEKTCPNVYLDQLVSIEDVTQRVQGAVPAGASDSAASAAASAASSRLEQECSTTTKLHCQVVSMYHGGQYQIYRYQRYQPVKLVFAPELQAGFFGGDPDNFTYPRYDLDVTFVRAYEADGVTPLHPKNYFRWRAEGAAPGEAVFVTGNPGSTSRLITVAQWMYERQFRHPFLINILRSRYQGLLEEAKQGPEAAQRVRQETFEISNSLKAYEGEQRGLLDTLLVARKIAWEREFRAKVAANPQLQSQFADVWDKLAAIAAEKVSVAPRLNAANPMLFPDALQLAGLIVMIPEQAALPEAQRNPQFRGPALQQLRTQAAQMPLDTGDVAGLAQRLRLLQSILPANDAFLGGVINTGETPEQAARRLVTSSRLSDVAFRQQLLNGGAAAINASTDPLVKLAREMSAVSRELTPRWTRLQADEHARRSTCWWPPCGGWRIGAEVGG